MHPSLVDILWRKSLRVKENGKKLVVGENKWRQNQPCGEGTDDGTTNFVPVIWVRVCGERKEKRAVEKEEKILATLGS